MSNEIVNALSKESMDGTSKAVLMTLAHIAHDDGKAWPSIETLSELTCFHRASVIRAIKNLETLGYLTANRENGRHTTYIVNRKPVAQCDPSHKATGSAVQLNPSHKATAPVAQSDTNHHESSINTNSENAKPVIDIFEQFWKAYPRHTAKQNARKAWDKLKITADDPRLDAMRRGLSIAKKSYDWLKDRGQFVPHAATWLNGKRWEDELTPENVVQIYSDKVAL